MSRAYVFGPMRSVRGYIDLADALIFSVLLDHQRDEGLGGGAAEIGVYFGRSYFLIRAHMAEGEKVVASDLFDIGEQAPGHSDQLDSFKETARRIGAAVDDDLILVGDSAELTPDDFLSRAGPIRFFSIDGGHERHHVATDSELAIGALAPHGVIAFDDFFNPAWPDVTTGVYDFLAKHGDRYSPFCISNKKLYVAQRDWAALYRGVVEGSGELRALPRSRLAFSGQEIVLVSHLLRKRIIFEGLSRVGLVALARGLY